ncbi:hypothetical protein LP419_37425 [Massilia sp. H-1]|nr:hypothetical protein LP419_37425 [Massilia sp. H-1]
MFYAFGQMRGAATWLWSQAAGAATTFSGVELITSSLRSKGYPHGTYDRPAIRIVEARAPGSAEGDTVRLLVERKEANDNGFQPDLHLLLAAAGR